MGSERKPTTVTDAQDERPVIYQAKFQEFLGWSQPFIYRLLKGLEPSFDQVVLTHRAANQRRFPMPKIETLNNLTLLSPYHAHLAAHRLQGIHRGRLIHAHFGYSAIRVLLLKIMMRVPMVVTFGGKDITVHARQDQTRRVYQEMFECVEQFVAVSDDLRRQAIDMGCRPEKIRTIRRGTDTEYFAFMDRSGRLVDDVRFLMVSRLVAKKGHALVLQALGTLDQSTKWCLDVVGEGPEQSKLKKMAQEIGISRRVRFLGSGDSEFVRKAMYESDVLLHPSVTADDGDREGIPNVVVEAQATGMPVIASNHGGIPEAVCHGKTGFLIAESDILGLASFIRQVIDDPTLRYVLGRQSHERVLNELSLRKQVSSYSTLYKDLIQMFPPHHPSLVHPKISEEMSGLLRASLTEASATGDLSIAEMIERWILEANGDGSLGEPRWYAALWQMRNHIHPRIRHPLKRMVGGVMKHLLGGPKITEFEQEFWRKSVHQGVPSERVQRRK